MADEGNGNGNGWRGGMDVRMRSVEKRTEKAEKRLDDHDGWMTTHSVGCPRMTLIDGLTSELHDEERGVFPRLREVENDMKTIKPVVRSLERLHLKVAGGVGAVMAIFWLLEHVTGLVARFGKPTP